MDFLQINLCEDIVRQMKSLEFKNDSISVITNDARFVEAYNKDSNLQKTILTMLFYNVLMSGPFNVPSQIRIALNIATSVEGWLEDIKLVILPWLKVNEETFF